MHYPDLTCYRDGELHGIANVYPDVKNIGWLEENELFEKGEVSPALILKLKEILFLDVKNNEEKRRGIFDKHQAICVHQMHMRGSPYKCPLCKKNITNIQVKPEGVNLYSGQTKSILGLNEICIPSIDGKKYYSFPTMLYHYITEHNYKPPDEFLDALFEFDLTKPYDIDEALKDLKCIKMPMKDVNNYIDSQ